MSKVIDRTGQKFNSWTFISYQGNNKHGEAEWLCKCNCGFERLLPARNVAGGYSKCCKSCSRTKNYKDELPSPTWKVIINNAKNRNIEVKITKEDAYKLYLNQNGKCNLSGQPIYFIKSFKDYSLGKQTASLDRIDSSKGYIKGNLQWIHKDINIMKNNILNKDFIEYCKLIANYHNEKTT